MGDVVGVGEGEGPLEEAVAGKGEGLGLSRMVVGDSVLGSVVLGEGVPDDCEGSGENVVGEGG